MKTRHSDDERENWVLQDEGLYNMQKRSRLSMRKFIRENRAMIDEVMDNVVSGKKQPSYLVYG